MSRCAGAPGQTPYTTPRSAEGSARGTEGPFRNPALRATSLEWLCWSYVTSAKLPLSRPAPDAAVTWGNGPALVCPALVCPLGTGRSGLSFPRGPVEESMWTWPRPRPGEESPGYLEGGWQNRGRKQPSGKKMLKTISSHPSNGSLSGK